MFAHKIPRELSVNYNYYFIAFLELNIVDFSYHRQIKMQTLAFTCQLLPKEFQPKVEVST